MPKPSDAQVGRLALQSTQALLPGMEHRCATLSSTA